MLFTRLTLVEACVKWRRGKCPWDGWGNPGAGALSNRGGAVGGRRSPH
ncbi:hypothetical protein CLOSTASPAR_03944 [[Clostridium] asparagiforme DSM 15981]|uniref:Uncharacterized protein n=1 Tax=[Clostridium] asparagiforme DSM 15981 TaxID=518636 RepID=C0D3V3_9FIRM|nr:hypothetical protein CLOSTASPAR_03944 [[Clostridium] asparagiforme DSM 15981]